MPTTFFSHLVDSSFSSFSKFVNVGPCMEESSSPRLPATNFNSYSIPKGSAANPALLATPDMALLSQPSQAVKREMTFPIIQTHPQPAPFIVSLPSTNGISDYKPPMDPSFPKRTRTRTRTACDSCRKRKTQCDGTQPCQKCQHYRRPCVYDAAAKEVSSAYVPHGFRGPLSAISKAAVSEGSLPQAHLLCPQPLFRTEPTTNSGVEHASPLSSNMIAGSRVNSAHSSISATSRATPTLRNAESENSFQHSRFETTPNGNAGSTQHPPSEQSEPSMISSSSISGLHERISNMEHLLVELNLRLSSSNGQLASDRHGSSSVSSGQLPHPINPLQDYGSTLNGVYYHPHHPDANFGSTAADQPHNTNLFSNEQSSCIDASSMQMAAPLREQYAHATHLKRILAPEGTKKCILNGPRIRMDQTFAQYSLVSVLSAESAAWFRHKIALDPQVGGPLTNLYVAFTNMVQTMADRWRGLSSTINLNQHYFALYSPELIDEILHLWYARHPWASYICPLLTVCDVFRQYRGNEAPVPASYMADILLMHIAIALAISNCAPGDCIDPTKYPLLTATLESALHAMRVDCFDTAVAIFNSSNQACENIVHLQAVCLMFLYNQSTYIVDLQSGYMLASTMIRFAQQMGYHMFESFDKEVTAHERELRRRIWWLCCVAATESTFETGKPMLLYLQQLSTLSENDMHYLADAPPANSGQSSVEALYAACAESPDAAQMYFAHFRLRLCRIKEKALLELCGPRSKSLPISTRAATMDHVNSSLNLLAEAMDPAVRPIFLTLPQVVTNDFAPPIENCPEFLAGKTHVQLLAFEFKIAYLSCISLVNRIPFYEAQELSTSQAIFYGDSALNASRAVMALVACTSPLPLWPRLMIAQMMQLPLVIYCGMISTYIAHPLHPHAVIDCRVLVQASMKFFASSATLLPGQWETLRERYTRLVMSDFISRILLRILVTEFAEKADHDYCDRVPGLAAHLIECSRIYPDMFEPNASARSTVNLVFETNLDFTTRQDGSTKLRSPHVPSATEPGKGLYGCQLMVQRSRNGWHETHSNEAFDSMLSNMAMDQQLLGLQVQQSYGGPT